MGLTKITLINSSMLKSLDWCQISIEPSGAWPISQVGCDDILWHPPPQIDSVL